MEREKINEAMETIKTVCREQLVCNDECPFYVKGINGEILCYIQINRPDHWFTNSINKHWKAYI